MTAGLLGSSEFVQWAENGLHVDRGARVEGKLEQKTVRRWKKDLPLGMLVCLHVQSRLRDQARQVKSRVLLITETGFRWKLEAFNCRDSGVVWLDRMVRVRCGEKMTVNMVCSGWWPGDRLIVYLKVRAVSGAIGSKWGSVLEVCGVECVVQE